MHLVSKTTGHCIAAIVLALVVGGASPAAAQVYVDQDATGARDGSSWADAYTDLQRAIDNATGADELWIAAGIYRPGGEDESFLITGAKDGLALYGGFDATETTRAQRAPTLHRTILSGDLDGDDVDPDGDGIIESADPNQDGTPDALKGPNANRVLVFDGGFRSAPFVEPNITPETVIDGIVVTAGQADGAFPQDRGAGLYCDGMGPGNQCSPTLRNVVFAGNAAFIGGAIFADGDAGTASPIITDATFTGNMVWSHGGAIFNSGLGGAARPVITRAAFVGNTASENGGAIYNDGSDHGSARPVVTNVTFAGNVAQNGGAIYNDGTMNGSASPFITNATFTGNAALFDGGAMYNDGWSDGEAAPQITNSILWNNTATGSGDEMLNNLGRTSESSSLLTHTIIEGGVNGPGVEGGSNTYGGGNQDADPVFLAPSLPAGPDGAFRTADDGLNIGADSPALDAGTNQPFWSGGVAEGVSMDITGGERFLDRDENGTATVNIGAYETAPPTVAASAPPPYCLTAPAPNPATLGATMRLAVQEAQPVRVAVYDVLGREVAVLRRGPMSAQQPTTLRVGEGLPAGQYFVRAVGERFRATERLTVVR